MYNTSTASVLGSWTSVRPYSYSRVSAVRRHADLQGVMAWPPSYAYPRAMNKSQGCCPLMSLRRQSQVASGMKRTTAAGIVTADCKGTMEGIAATETSTSHGDRILTTHHQTSSPPPPPPDVDEPLLRIEAYRRENEARRRKWIARAIDLLQADAARSADTHLIKVDWKEGGDAGVHLYLKDESVHPTGSLKHRLARSLFVYALANNKIGPDTKIVEASSGSTAVSEAYFAKLLGLEFVAVMMEGTSKAKCQMIQHHGGECRFVRDCAAIYMQAQRIADTENGHFMNQFLNAERATDWRSNNNIAESIFTQMAQEEYPTPAWVCVGAGTGGTSATIGRYVRYSGNTQTRLCVADPENSVFMDSWQSGGDRGIIGSKGSRIEGIGRPRVEESFLPDLIDDMKRVPDSASLAAMRFIGGVLGRRVGATTGTSIYAAMQLADEMIRNGEKGSIVCLICDSGERYTNTYYDDAWVSDNGFCLEPYMLQASQFWNTLQWVEPDIQGESISILHEGSFI